MNMCVLGVVMSGVVGIGLVEAKPDTTPLLNEILSKLEQLQATVNTLEADVVGLGGALQQVQSDVQTLQTTVDGLSVDVDLRGVAQNWDKKLDSTNGEANGCNSDRFTCLWPDDNGQATAVRDNETGLVWDRTPDIGSRNWASAVTRCAQREVGGRKGWSLPMGEQLASLVDDSNSDSALPTGHPFLNVQSAFYWSVSARVESPASVWTVNFLNGDVILDFKVLDHIHWWCVRGGQTYDGQDVQNVINALP